ncbi:hypothetical protein BB559_005054 [Furculomyces boomerangus]|uniref:Uncharacterized protein n=2 Tax=Harpellales TaxID=61421 RepID=A0A2T9YB26_9FUNG|nr:hypothetical protein BB559_005054 [Furculomyces boomerangus]PWA00018.1 hypothetical protein BB558_003894 [Smittium angustum]PWA02474.1 hypothetical protein BB558_001362 [Smittium angustum]
MGNGAKAQTRRDRNAKDKASKAGSQLKVNQQAKNIVCTVCRSTFLCTSRAKSLAEHAENKHNKKLEDCFPGFVEPV